MGTPWGKKGGILCEWYILSLPEVAGSVTNLVHNSIRELGSKLMFSFRWKQNQVGVHQHMGGK